MISSIGIQNDRKWLRGVLKIASALAMVFLLLILNGVSVTDAQYWEISDIRALHSAKCMDVKGASTATGALVQQYQCHQGANQQIEISDAGGGWYQLKFRHSNLCLDVPGGTPDLGEQLWQWPCNGTDAQKFLFLECSYCNSIMLTKTDPYLNTCVDVDNASTANGAKIMSWPCNGGNNQKWIPRQMGIGDLTGYAMGNLIGGGQVEVVQGDFASHHPSYCPGDPAAWWPYGTWITTVGSVGPFHNGSNGTTYYTSNFYLYDVGDPNCLEGNYWADIYFGRYKLSYQACNCSGSPSGTCYNGVVNHCNDASNWGRQANRPGKYPLTVQAD